VSEDNLVILCLVTHQGDESLSQSDGACANPVIFGHTRGIPHENEQKTSCEVVVRAVKSSNWVDRSPAVWRARAACFVAESKLVLPASRHFAPIAPASHTGASCANGDPRVCAAHIFCVSPPSAAVPRLESRLHTASALHFRCMPVVVTLEVPQDVILALGAAIRPCAEQAPPSKSTPDSLQNRLRSAAGGPVVVPMPVHCGGQCAVQLGEPPEGDRRPTESCSGSRFSSPPRSAAHDGRERRGQMCVAQSPPHPRPRRARGWKDAGWGAARAGVEACPRRRRLGTHRPVDRTHPSWGIPEEAPPTTLL
jgi:hypothetical protein